MFRPVPMCKVNVLILQKHVTPVTEALGRLGLMHLVDAVAQSREHLLDVVDRRDEIRDLETLTERCAAVLESLGVERAEPEGDIGPLSRDRAAETIAEIEERYREEDAEMTRLLTESGELEQRSERLRRHPVQTVRLEALRSLSHLYVVTGRLSPSLVGDAREALGDQALIFAGDEGGEGGNVLVVSSRRHRWGVESDLNRLGFSTTELPEDLEGTPGEEQDRIGARVDRIGEAMAACRRRVLELAADYSDLLLAMRRQMQNSLTILRAQQRFGRSSHLYCISGWVPRLSVEQVQEIVRDLSGGTGIVETVAAGEDVRVREGEEQVPVQFEDGPVRRPFQALIANFGAPRYSEIDPTLFVALSFVTMFGVMFGDIGQGLVIAAIGVWLWRTRRPVMARFRDAGMLLALCGGSATVFGLLYGSVFGYENPAVLPPVWLSPLHDVPRLLGTAVVMGIVFNSIAVGINIINKIRAKHYFEGIFDRFGALGIVFYWGAIGIGLKAAKAGELSGPMFVLLIIVPLGLLFIREPIHNLMRGKSPLHTGVFSFLLESSIETMETVTAFLGSTVSFVRVGAFALSHAALCLAIYSVVGMIRDLPLGNVWSVIILIFGNVLIIAMEGMVAMIQGVRLQYYELFSKYYKGDGVLYHPFRFSERQANRDDLQGDAAS